jgi:hypothetical protein
MAASSLSNTRLFKVAKVTLPVKNVTGRNFHKGLKNLKEVHH